MNNRLSKILLGIGVSLFPALASAIPPVSSESKTGETYRAEKTGSIGEDYSYSNVVETSNPAVGPKMEVADEYSVMVSSTLMEATDEKEERESLFPKASRSLSGSHFTWGAEFGASIDLSGYDTSTFNVDAVLGYKNNYFRILGVGCGVHRSLGNADTFIPVYALMRTSFSPRPRLFFMSLKVGYSFNTMGDSPMFGDTNAQLGAGINLAMSKKFQSHIILAYEFRHFNKRHKYILNDKEDDISLATISFGVNF